MIVRKLLKNPRYDIRKLSKKTFGNKCIILDISDISYVEAISLAQ